MAPLVMCARRSLLLAVLFIGLSALNAYADGGQTIASDQLYGRSSRWFITTDGKGHGCGLAIPYGKNEFIHVFLENKSNVLVARFAYLKAGLNLSLSGNYEFRLVFDNGYVFGQRAEVYDGEVYDGFIVDIDLNLLAELSKNRMLNLKVGEVSYGNYDLTFLKAGIPRLYDCMMDTTKWDVTASMSLRKRLAP